MKVQDNDGCISLPRFKSTYSHLDLDHEFVNGLDPECLREVERLCEPDSEAKFLKDVVIDPQLLRHDAKFGIQAEGGGEFQEQSHEKLAREIVGLLKTSTLLTMQALLQPSQSSPHGYSKKGETALNYVLTPHITRDPDEYEEIPKSLCQQELVITVRVSSLFRPTKCQEFLVLGSNTLTELRDAIYCISDRINERETLGLIDTLETPLERLLELRGPGFFFIENSFYSDTRHEASTEYSQNIVDWINQQRIRKNSRYNPHTTPYSLSCGNFVLDPIEGDLANVDMVNVRLDQLTIVPGRSYLYMHCGSCEHIVQFMRVRFLHEYDERNRKAYPLTIYHSKIRRRRCRCCDIYSASYVTFGDRFSPENPCFYCERCYFDFHYNSNGTLMYSDYKVYHYIHE